MTAHELLPKLGLLYKIGMTSLLHHLDQKNFKTRTVVAKNASSKQGAVFERMQFPMLQHWDAKQVIKENLPVEMEKEWGHGGSSNRSTGRESTYSVQGQVPPQGTAVFMQTSIGSQKDVKDAKQLRRTQFESKRSNSGDHHVLKDGTTRRSSSISADQVMALAN